MWGTIISEQNLQSTMQLESAQSCNFDVYDVKYHNVMMRWLRHMYKWHTSQGVMNKTMSQAHIDRFTTPNDNIHRNKEVNIRCEDAYAIRMAYIYMIMMN